MSDTGQRRLHFYEKLDDLDDQVVKVKELSLRIENFVDGMVGASIRDIADKPETREPSDCFVERLSSSIDSLSYYLQEINENINRL